MKLVLVRSWIVLILAAAFVLVAVPATPGHAESFDYETIAPYIISHPSLTMDSEGDAHLAYYYVSNSSGFGVEYARRHLGTWTFELVAPTSVYDVALALDPAGNPHIAYYPAGDARVQYASRVGGQWVSEPADELSEVSGSLSLDFDGQGRPHVAYPWSGALKHAVRTDTGWITDVVDPAIGTSSYPGISLRVDALGRPCVSYHGGSSIWFARRTTGAWTRTPVASTDWYIETSLALDAQGTACFAYPDDLGLRLARETTGGWVTELVDGAPAVGGSASLALDASGNAHIGYYDATNGALKYARRSATGWDVNLVDTRRRSGQETALALDGGGRPALAYTFRGYTGGDLHFATETPGVAGVGDAPRPSSLALAPPVPSPAAGGRATLSFRLERAERVSFGLFDVAGHRVAVREAESFEAGAHTLSWDSGQRTPGVYFVRLVTGSGIEAEQRWVIVR